MADYQVGDVLLVNYPFKKDDGTTVLKKRPVVLKEKLKDAAKLCVYCTSQLHHSNDNAGKIIEKGTEAYKEMGLLTPTFVWFGRTRIVEAHEIVRLIGKCPESLIKEILNYTL